MEGRPEPVRTVPVSERRARLVARHHLARPGTRVEQVAGHLVGFHASDPATVYLAAWARVPGFAVADLEDALYERRALVRMLGMRRTMFVVPRELAAVMDSACTQALAPAERRRAERLVAEGGISDDPGPWLERVESDVLRVLADRGEATAAELRADVPELGHQIAFGEGRRWAGTIGLSTRVLFLLATEGRVVRGRPRGTWLSSQYRWATTEGWLGTPLHLHPPGEARTDLARRWLRAFGPATVADLKWWAGWTVRQTTAALDALGAVPVTLDGGATGFVLPDDLAPEPEPARESVALLPGLDPTVMGWKERSWYLGPHREHLFDRNGNAGATVWADGRIVGGWAQMPDGRVAVELLEDPGSRARRAIATEAARLEDWLGGVRVTPRFRTPLERRLAASAQA